MQKLSVVIVCKNSATVIARTIESFEGLTDDIVVYDNGSTDGTQQIIAASGAKLINGNWEGFGKTKNKANGLAKYDWILSLDADEAIDRELKNALLQLSLENENQVYDLSFKNFVGDKYLKYGEWGKDHHIRLFNKNKVSWNDAAVHEQLMILPTLQVLKIKGYVLHYTTSNFRDYEIKMNNYAMLNAEKYLLKGKKTWVGKQWFAAGFSFLKNFIFRLGFLDGRAGYDCARITARYTYLKYANLKTLTRQEKK